MKKSVILMALVAGSVGAAETPAPVFQNLRYDDNAVTREAAVIHTTFKLNDAASWSAGGQVRAAVAGKPNWHVVDWTDRCGSLAHFDDPDGVAQLIESHIAGAAQPPAQPEPRGRR